MIKTIWIVNPYAEPPHFETRLRSIKNAHFLMKQGYRVLIFGGSFIHNTDINLITENETFINKQYDDLNFIHIKTPAYRGNGVKRFANLSVFYHRFKRIYKQFEKPDLIIHAGTIPFGYDLYKIANVLGCQYFTEIYDLWPESFVCFQLLKRDSFIHKLLKKFEFVQYAHSDNIIFSMEGGKDYMIEQDWDKKIDMQRVHYINNGVDLAEFNQNAEAVILVDDDLVNDKFKIIYLGSIRLANNLIQLIKAAEVIQQLGYEDIQFLIYGDGTERETLKLYAEEHHLNNVIFKQKHIGIEYVPYVLTKSSLNILNYMDNDIWKYGGSQSKLFQYLASGKPILSNLEIGYCIVTQNDCGLAKSFQNHEEYAQAILSFYKLGKEQYQKICQNCKETAKHYDYERLTDELIALLNKTEMR